MSPHKGLTGALAAVLIGAGVAAASPGSIAAAASASKEADGQAITLITGDIVHVSPAGGRRAAVAIEPGPGRTHVTFATTETERGVRVIPSDATPLLASGRLDADLFDVQNLLADGYGDADGATLPLIVQSAQGTATARALNDPAEVSLPSIDAVAVRAAKGSLAGFWRTHVAAGADARTAITGKIWLDGRVEAALDRSTAQIGAPDAWRAGLDGHGVEVAVLDTGVDASHPDLAGRIAEARDFSGKGSAVDGHGHGTHVAATVAGSGAGSNGTRKGVAPGARLLIGKVLSDAGSGSESDTIAGMEWAAHAGAKVVNMSLGADPTDGTDPTSLAVDELSASTGALFVIAAGNAGSNAYTVSSPGSARSALTVGAVDRDDAIAPFSSRGPRVGDEGLKPEITAPGVGIVAARASGTAMGDVVDELYTSASGTSMATPHVAGAAAIIAQQHPDWTGPKIKDELVSTAKTTAGTPVYAQGAGRVDLTRATSQQVFGTGVADFGARSVAESPTPMKRTVTYTNTASTAVTLTLAEDVAAVTASAATVTVPAGGSAAVTLTVDPARAAAGRFSGNLSATGPGGVRVTTAIGGTLEKKRHQVTFKAIDRDGQAGSTEFLFVNGDDVRFDTLGQIPSGGTFTAALAEGDYLVDTTIREGGDIDLQATVITIPELRVDRDMTVLLDARKGTPIRIETPRPAEQQELVGLFASRVTGTGRKLLHGFFEYSAAKAINVTPTAKLRAGSYEFSSRWQLVAPMTRADVPGVGDDLDVHLYRFSPAYDGPRRFDLVRGLSGNVRGKAVLIDSGDEDTAAAAAAAAGAAFTLFVVPADRSAAQWWTPDGEYRTAIPTALVGHRDGQRLLARAARPGAGITLTLTPDSPYLYDVYQVAKDRVPSQIVHKVTAANSHRVTAAYPHNGGFEWIREQRFGWRPSQQYAFYDRQRFVRTPSVREEWVSTGDTLWQHKVHHEFPWNDYEAGLSDAIQQDPVTYPKAGRSMETWYGPVVRPATPAGQHNVRAGNTLRLRVASWVDSDGHYLTAEGNLGITQTRATLSRDGVELAALADGWRDVPVPAGNGTFELTVSTGRDRAEWLYGTSTTTAWTFKSGPDGELPLLQVGYEVKVSPTGTATRRPHLLGVKVPGARKVTVQTSADEGKSWRTAAAIGSAVVVPAGTVPVSLRVIASDKAGNSVTQTVIRAYGRS